MRARTYLPRPEYPRPDRQRAFVHGRDWLNLNGAWEFRFDGECEGILQKWYLVDDSQWHEQIIVPFCWESLAAWGEADACSNEHYFARRVYRDPIAVDRNNHRYAARYEVGWYRREIMVPDNEYWRGKRVILTIGAADFYTDCWCNGRYVGHHEDGYLPFEFDLTDSLERGVDGVLVAHVVLRVEDPMDNHEQPVGKQWGWYSSASGIWQTVFLEPRAEVAIERFEISGDIEAREVRLMVFTNGGSELAVEILSPDQRQIGAVLPVSGGVACGTIPIDPLIVWDPSDPKLYRIVFSLGTGSEQDCVYSYFGMRSLSAMLTEEPGAPAALCLNGQAIYLRGALYQSYHAEGIYTAGDVQALKDDIAAAKRYGFDLLRIHIKIDDPLLLYYADEMGILLMADFPNFGEGGDTPLGRARYEQVLRGAIARDFNHPSIIAWCLFNETWGFGGQSEFVDLINPKPLKAGESPRVPLAAGTKLANQDAYTWIEEMWRLAKTLDPTRLVEDMSVVAWEHVQYYGHGATDINSWHFYSHDYGRARDHIRQVVEETYAGSTFNYVPGFQQGIQPLMNSEYGGIGALDGDRDVSWSFKFLTNELRLHGKLSAYIYTELHDVEWERNGFLNYDRTPKEFGYDPTIINQGDVLPIDAPPVSERSPGEYLEVAVYSSHFSRRHYRDVTLYWRLSGVDSLGRMHDDLASGTKPISFRHLRVELAEKIRLKLPRETMLCTLWVRAMTPAGALIAANYVQFYVDSEKPQIERCDGEWLLRLAPHEFNCADWSGSHGSADDAKAQGACFGRGRGFFEWQFSIGAFPLDRLRRIRILGEASSCRDEHPQTDAFSYPTLLRMELNGVRVYESPLPNHPHDARGALSYLRDAYGAYGYLTPATVEGALLDEVRGRCRNGTLTLRQSVPEDAAHRGGLVIYGARCGRYPIAPTLIMETDD